MSLFTQANCSDNQTAGSDENKFCLCLARIKGKRESCFRLPNSFFRTLNPLWITFGNPTTEWVRKWLPKRFPNGLQIENQWNRWQTCSFSWKSGHESGFFSYGRSVNAVHHHQFPCVQQIWLGSYFFRQENFVHCSLAEYSLQILCVAWQTTSCNILFDRLYGRVAEFYQ